MCVVVNKSLKSRGIIDGFLARRNNFRRKIAVLNPQNKRVGNLGNLRKRGTPVVGIYLNCRFSCEKHYFKPKKQVYFHHKSLIVRRSPWSGPGSRRISGSLELFSIILHPGLHIFVSMLNFFCIEMESIDMNKRIFAKTTLLKNALL